MWYGFICNAGNLRGTADLLNDSIKDFESTVVVVVVVGRLVKVVPGQSVAEVIEPTS